MGAWRRMSHPAFCSSKVQLETIAEQAEVRRRWWSTFHRLLRDAGRAHPVKLWLGMSAAVTSGVVTTLLYATVADVLDGVSRGERLRGEGLWGLLEAILTRQPAPHRWWLSPRAGFLGRPTQAPTRIPRPTSMRSEPSVGWPGGLLC